jgi:fatty-acyl-CoA synthase
MSTGSFWSDPGLRRRPANHAPLTPLTFLRRAADVFAGEVALSYGGRRETWAEHAAACRRLASALRLAGLPRGGVVGLLMANTPPMLAAHFAVPMAGGVLNTINTRLDRGTVAYILEHSGARLLIVDAEFLALARGALEALGGRAPRVFVYADRAAGFPPVAGEAAFEDLLAEGDPDAEWEMPEDEWAPIAVNYTSGTTARPKGVVYSHRGAYLAALSLLVSWGVPKRPSFLWTVPLFHCNGWCMPWLLALQGGRSVCLRRMDAERIVESLLAERVTHYGGAPVVHQLIREAAEVRGLRFDPPVQALIGGAPPPAPLIEGMDRIGVQLTHAYGLTETYGPAALCEPRPEWSDLGRTERAAANARQGVRSALQEDMAVVDPETLGPVPRDGEAVGEIVFRGNLTMMGYLRDPEATDRAFEGGFLRSGDLATVDPDGYARIRDRSKDIIISGGENISSVEVEEALYRHPSVAAAAVVAMPDPRWGETPVAFVELRDGWPASETILLAHCRRHLARFKCPRRVLTRALPRTATGKIRKNALRQAIRDGEIVGLAEAGASSHPAGEPLAGR